MQMHRVGIVQILGTSKLGVAYSNHRAGFCEHSNEPSSSLKGGKFHGWLSDCYFLKQ
jgi:hypothetical protein